MVRMDLKELTIHRNKKDFIDLLSVSPHVEIEGLASSIDIPEINEMFCLGPIYLMTKAEAEEYLELKHAEEVRKFKEAQKTKEEENNEE